MSKTAQFREKVKQLQAELKGCEQELANRDEGSALSSISALQIAAAAVPVVILAIFFFWSPKFLMKKEGGKSVRDWQRILLCTAGATIALWVCMYLGKSYMNGAKSSE